MFRKNLLIFGLVFTLGGSLLTGTNTYASSQDTVKTEAKANEDKKPEEAKADETKKTEEAKKSEETKKADEVKVNDTKNANESKKTITDSNQKKSSKIKAMKPYKELKNFLKKELKLSKNDAKETRYYYEKVDLNNDKKEEILALVVGPAVSGNAGSPLYLLKKDGKSFKVQQVITTVQPPIYLSKKTSNGYKNLVIMQSGGGAKSSYKELKFRNGKYESLNAAKAIKKPANTKKLFNVDLAKDLNEHQGLYLG